MWGICSRRGRESGDVGREVRFRSAPWALAGSRSLSSLPASAATRPCPRTAAVCVARSSAVQRGPMRLQQPDSHPALRTRGPGCHPSSAAALGSLHGPGTGAPTVTAALERTPDAQHRRNVVPEPQPRRQAQAHATDCGCGGSRLIRPNPDHPFWAPISSAAGIPCECHRILDSVQSKHLLFRKHGYGPVTVVVDNISNMVSDRSSGRYLVHRLGNFQSRTRARLKILDSREWPAAGASMARTGWTEGLAQHQGVSPNTMRLLSLAISRFRNFHHTSLDQQSCSPNPESVLPKTRENEILLF